MLTLLIPAAGSSKRFPNLKPKWMLTHPSGYMMLVESIGQFNLKNVSSIKIVLLKEHLIKYNCKTGIEQQFKERYPGIQIDLIELQEKTKSQSETVSLAIELANITGAICIKDSDNCFDFTPEEQNQIVYGKLSEHNLKNLANKSYLSLNDDQIVSKITEKKVESSNFCVGGYSFNSAQNFIEEYSQIKQYEESGEIYISHVIHKMLLDGAMFKGVHCNIFEDWGTLEDWNQYKNKFITLFVDIDGVLVTNTSNSIPPLWGEGKKLENNVKFLQKLYETKKCQIILTTSRKNWAKDKTIHELNQIKMPYNQIIFDLFHAKRAIVNDYADTNPYPSCLSINLERDSDKLEKLMSAYI